LRFILLDDAVNYVESNKEAGVVCPCCKSLVSTYNRYVYVANALWLIVLVKLYLTESRFYHVGELNPILVGHWPNVPFGGGDHSKLRYWGLIKEMPKDERDRSKRTSGHWMPTQDGIEFALGRLAVPKKAVEFRGQCLRLEGDPITINDALKKKFDFREIKDNMFDGL
jgi:hypothetical protein